MAIKDTAPEWRNKFAPALADIEALALEAYAHLPAEFRNLTGEVIIVVAEFPDEDIIEEMDLETPFDLLGLFEGRPVSGKMNPLTGEFPNRVTLYRRGILDYWADHEETLADIVTHVLVHEIGHHFGLSDDDMEALEMRAP